MLGIYEYHLLPALWQAMTPEHKGEAVSIFKNHNSTWRVECIIELKAALGIRLSDMNAIQVTIWCAIENPSHIERGLEDADLVEGKELPAEVVAQENERQTATHDLAAWRLHPRNMSDMDLFNHMLTFRCCSYAHRQEEHKISDHNRII